jgi:hypothetical protein
LPNRNRRRGVKEVAPKVHNVNVSLAMEGVVTAHADVVVVSTIAQLRQAVKEQQPEIIFKLPDWLQPPDSLPALLHQMLLGMLALAIFALVRGYNVEFGPKIVVKGVEISFPMKLTIEKSTPHDGSSKH